MTIRKLLISLVFMAIIALTFVACSGTKDVCPAYSTLEAKMSVNPNG